MKIQPEYYADPYTQEVKTWGEWYDYYHELPNTSMHISEFKSSLIKVEKDLETGVWEEV